MYELNGNSKYRSAALQLADETLQEMKATKFGVLFIKEKERSTGEEFAGGGPPALGWYASALAYIYHKEGNRNADLKYVATVLDQFPWSEQGWWSADIDIKTGVSKQPLTKPAPVNKTAAVAMAAGMASAYVKEIAPELSVSLKRKTDACIYGQVIPAQQPDGFWHYGLTERDPKNKDILGYFMLGTDFLIQLQWYNDDYREAKLNSALEKAGGFALTNIAPLTDPNQGAPSSGRTTSHTPQHYSAADDNKRSFQLGAILFAQQYSAEGIKIVDEAVKHFPYGNTSEDGARAAYPAALILSMLKRETESAK